MPSWLLSILINLVLKFGLPWVVVWVKKRFPWLPIDQIVPVLEDHIKGVGEQKAQTKARLRECYGLVGCPTDLQNDFPEGEI